MKNFNGQVLFLDRADINTDEIIPAKYLTEITKAALKPFLLEDLKIEGFEPSKDLEDISVIVTKENFGCGSSREHAPWALEVNGINLVIAENFARIFHQNMFNCGMMAIELPKGSINQLFVDFAAIGTEVLTDFGNSKITFKSAEKTMELDFNISSFNRELIKSGGWVDYADNHY